MPYIIRHSFFKTSGTTYLQCCKICHLLSDSSSKLQSSNNLPNFAPKQKKLDELRVSWEGITYKLIPKKCHLKSNRK